jgi:membrane-anchored glycerophosphoryl diester phosphodiesterase (GDPDase)
LAFFVLIFGAAGFDYYPGVSGVDPISLLLSYLGLLGPTGTVIFFIVLIGIINTVFLAIINGAGVKYALDNYGNREAGEIGESFSHALARALTLIITQLVVSLIILAIVSPIIVLAFGAIIAFDPLDPYASLAALAAFLPVFLVCFILVFYIAIRLTVITGVVIAEDLSVIDSIKRAWALTGGNFWHVFGASILIGIVTLIISAVLSIGAAGLILYDPTIATVIGTYISLLFVAPIANVFQAVLYKDLRSRLGVAEQEWW